VGLILGKPMAEGFTPALTKGLVVLLGGTHSVSYRTKTGKKREGTFGRRAPWGLPNPLSVMGKRKRREVGFQRK